MKAFEAASELGVYEMWQLHRERTALAKVYLDRWNSCEGLDAILGLKPSFLIVLFLLLTTPLGPTMPYASVKHGDFKYVGYTGIWNVLDYTALSFPTGITADKNLDAYPADFKSMGELDTEIQGKCE
jgi:amidase